MFGLQGAHTCHCALRCLTVSLRLPVFPDADDAGIDGCSAFRCLLEHSLVLGAVGRVRGVRAANRGFTVTSAMRHPAVGAVLHGRGPDCVTLRHTTKPTKHHQSVHIRRDLKMCGLVSGTLTYRCGVMNGVTRIEVPEQSHT